MKKLKDICPESYRCFVGQAKVFESRVGLELGEALADGASLSVDLRCEGELGRGVLFASCAGLRDGLRTQFRKKVDRNWTKVTFRVSFSETAYDYDSFEFYMDL